MDEDLRVALAASEREAELKRREDEAMAQAIQDRFVAGGVCGVYVVCGLTLEASLWPRTKRPERKPSAW
jgi:hypothetical protein